MVTGDNTADIVAQIHTTQKVVLRALPEAAALTASKWVIEEETQSALRSNNETNESVFPRAYKRL